MGQLLLQGEFALPVVSALTQHERLYDAAQRVCGKLRMGDEHGLLRFVAAVNRRQFPSIPGLR
jgi:hypothetical protein